MLIIDQSPRLFKLIMGALLLLAPVPTFAQETAAPANQNTAEAPAANEGQKPAAEEKKSFLEKAKAAAAAAAAKTKEAAAAAAAKTKAAAVAATEKAKAAAATAAEKTKAAAKVAIEKTKEAANVVAEKTSETLKKAKEATKKVLGKDKPAQVEGGESGAPEAAAKQANPQVIFKTSHGDFVVELNPEKAPITVKNFLSYVDSGYYSGTIFHRVISSFMIQGGGFTPDMNKKATQAPIVLESKKGLSNLRGTIAMARTNNPNSATSQFFINVVNNRNLDSYGGGYAVFGKVISGMETVDKIRAVRTAPRSGHRDVPVENVVI
jgi:peptidyl-prolyl cis-trans isomerase A (cyclophilin A)